MNVLIRLHRGYGLGDAVQMSSVLRHVAKYRPNWVVDFQAEEGRHCVGRGIVANTFAYDDPYPTNQYDAEVEIRLYDTWMNWHDRPNTRVSSCLHEHFGLPWDEECSRYQVNVSQLIRNWAITVVPNNAVAYHYQGDSSKGKKDLTDNQAKNICKTIWSFGMTPYKLGRHIPKGYDAEVNCAIIRQCRAFIGIDSGPAKCASATNTPSLVIWTKHHPAEFHDPAPNTTHLVPHDYHSLHPVNNDWDVIKWFETHYNVIRYTDECSMQIEIVNWLRKVL